MGNAPNESHEALGPYRAERLLSTGAQAQVWLATGPEGEVALKIARTDGQRDALLREARALSRVDHPCIVRLLRAAPDGSWLALERLGGVTLDRWADGRSPAEIVSVARQLLHAVAHLHKKGVIHGDLKPANVVVDAQGTPRVLDLGVATLAGEPPVRGLRGTPGYVAPEILRGERPTPATDMYGFGGVLYAAFTGRAPFVAPDPAALGYLPLVSLPMPPSSLRPGLPALLNQLILLLLARDASRRPQSVDKVEEVLGRSIGGASATVVVGMADEREELRRAVIGAADGECRVVVLYGPPGSGRRTLMTEAVEAARREGLPFLQEGELEQIGAQIRAAKRPPVVTLRAAQEGVLPFVKGCMAKEQPGLFLVHSDRPQPLLEGKGCAQITPSPLSRDDAERLIRVHGADPERATDFWRDSLGHPLGIIGRVRRWKRENGGLDSIDRELPAPSRKILQACRRQPETALPELAKTVGMSEHDLLDHCEILFAEGLIEPTRNGAAVIVTERGRRPVTMIPD